MLPYLFDTLDFQKGEEIFETPYTKVYKCTNKITCQDFVAKEIIIYRENEYAFKFLYPINKLCEISHPNICPIYGYTLNDFERKPHQMVISPYYSNGSLDNFFMKNELSIFQRAQICCGIADAISYLHEMKIIHGSINASNILIDFDNCPKLILPFSKSENLKYVMDILDDYRHFATLAFKILTYKKENQSFSEISSEIPQEIQSLIQRCFNIKNEITKNENFENNDDFDILSYLPFSYISKEFKNAFNIPEDQLYERKLIQKFDIEPGERNVENLFWQGLVYLNDVPRQSNLVNFFIKSAADRNHPYALCRYAWMNLYGVGIEQNVEAAINYYHKAADRNVSEAQLQYGLLLLSQKMQVKESMNYYHLAYKNGNIEAAIRLGILLEKMNHIEDAIKFYQIGVDYNDSDAQCFLGEIYESQNKFEEAFDLYKKSADQLNPLGLYNLALLYENGFPKHKRDPQLAVKYAKLAANQEHPTGLWYYGYLIETGYDEDFNYELAAKYYRLSANLNDSFGLWHYGVLLEMGRGVPQDINEATRLYKKSADLGNEFGQCYYGIMLECGCGGVDKNINEAEKYYILSAKQINRDGLFHYACLLEKRNEIEKAHQYYRLAAKQNHPIALYRYAYYLENVKKDHNHALKYYYRASQFGNTDAMCCYAMLTDEEEDVGRYLKMSADLLNSEGQWRYGSYLLSKNNLKGAEKYFKLSAESGNPEGEWRYAYMLEKAGRINESEEYYKRSSIKNNAKGKSNLGFLAESGKVASDFITNYRSSAILGNDIGQFNYALVQMKQREDFVAVERFFKLSADQDNAHALYNLSKITESKDSVRSAEYMKKAAQLGLTEAEVSYGLMLERGYGVKKNVREAIKYYKMAAKKNDKNAQYNLALMLLNNADFNKAAILFKKSADQGHKLAALNIASMYEKGLGTEKNIENAVKYYQIASSSSSISPSSSGPESSSFLLAQENTNGVPEAQFNLASMYQNGTGVKQDLGEAYRLYKKASDAGLKHASYNLAVMLEQIYNSNRSTNNFNNLNTTNGGNQFGFNHTPNNSNTNSSILSRNISNDSSNINTKYNFNNSMNNSSFLNNSSYLNNSNFSNNSNYLNNSMNNSNYMNNNLNYNLASSTSNTNTRNLNNSSRINSNNNNVLNFNSSNNDMNSNNTFAYNNNNAFYNNNFNNTNNTTNFGNSQKVVNLPNAIIANNNNQNSIQSSNEMEIVDSYKKAAEKNVSDAQFRLYQIYSNGLFNVTKDDSVAISYLKRAADYGNNAKALFRYAVLLQTGISPSVEKNEETAVIYYKRAIETGSLVARVNLAAMIERGSGGLKKDEKLAANLYKEAADLGCTVGMFNYAVTLEKGNGVEKDIELAKRYYLKASQQGYKDAQERLQQLQEQLNEAE